MGKFKTSKSYFLTGCLVAVSFAIINCQKAPNRNGVKPNVANPAGTNAKVEETPVAQCETSTKDAVEIMRTITKDTKVTDFSSAGKTDSEKDALVTKRKSFIVNCDAVLKDLEKIPQKSCLLDKASKAAAGSEESDKNKILTSKVKQACDDMKAKQAEDTKAAVVDPKGTTDEEKRKEKDRKDKQTSATNYLKTKIVLVSDDVKDLSKEETAFEKYIADGEIKSDSKALEIANSNAKSIVCSISGNKIDKTVSKSVVMKFSTGYETISGESALKGFKGDAMTVALSRENDKSEKGMYDNTASNPILLTLTCLNVKATAIDIGDLKKALGIKSSGGKHLNEITDAKLKEQTNANEARFAALKAEELAAARAEEARRAAQSGAPAAGTGTATPAAPVVAVVPATAAEKTALIKAVTDARMALGEQKTKNAALKLRLDAANLEMNNASAALTTKKVSGADFRTLADKLIATATASKKADEKLATAKKGTDTAATAAADTAAKAAKKALDDLEKESLTKVKTAGTVETVKEFVTLYDKSIDANAKQAALAAEHVAEEAKIKDLEGKVTAAEKIALDKKVTQQELAPAAAVAQAAPVAAPTP